MTRIQLKYFVILHDESSEKILVGLLLILQLPSSQSLTSHGNLGLHERTKNNLQEALGIKPKRALRDGVKNLCSAICYCDVVIRLPTQDGFAKLLLVEFSSLAPALPDGPLHQ